MANSKNTLIQRIALEGGEQIEKELKALGVEGEAAWKKLKEGADSLAKSGTGVNSFFFKLKADLAGVQAGAKKVRAGFDDIGQGITTVTKNAAILLGVVTGLSAGLLGLAKSASDAADEQGKAAASAGLDIKTYGRLQFAFEQGNVAASAFQIGMKKFNVELDAAARTGLKTSGTFKKLGVDVLDANGKVRPTEAILEDIADKFAKLPNGANKTALSLQLFGKAGAAFVPVLNDGSKAIKDLGDQMERTGNVFTDAQAQIGDAFGDALNKITKDITGIKNQIGITLAPAFTEAFDAVSKILEDNQANILAFAKSITDQVIPAIKDIANALSGNDSAVANKNFLAIRDSLVKVAQAAGAVVDFIGTVVTVLENTIQPLVDLYNNTLGNIFGKIDSQTALITVAIFALTGGFKAFGLIAKGVSGILEGIAIAFGKNAAAIAGVIGRILLILGLLKTLVQDMVSSVEGIFAPVGQFFNDLTLKVINFFRLLAGKPPLTAMEQTKQAADNATAAVKKLGDASVDATAKTATVGEGFVKIADHFTLTIGKAGPLVAQLNDRIVTLSDGTSALFRVLEDGSLKIIRNMSDGTQHIEGFRAGTIAATNEIALRAAQASGDTAKAAEANVKSLALVTDSAVKATATATEQTGNSLVTSLTGIFTGLGNTITGIFNGILDLIKSALSLAAGLIGGGGSSGDKGSKAFAVGGHVRGPGSGTSDSILARLSNGEFVMRAAAVRRLGVSFLDSLNQGRANGFAMGGLVGGFRPSSALAGYASGGLVSGGGNGDRTPINLHLAGEVFADLLAPIDVADKLVQYAMGQKVRSGGKKPSWRK